MVDKGQGMADKTKRQETQKARTQTSATPRRLADFGGAPVRLSIPRLVNLPFADVPGADALARAFAGLDACLADACDRLSILDAEAVRQVRHGRAAEAAVHLSAALGIDAAALLGRTSIEPSEIEWVASTPSHLRSEAAALFWWHYGSEGVPIGAADGARKRTGTAWLTKTLAGGRQTEFKRLLPTISITTSCPRCGLPAIYSLAADGATGACPSGHRIKHNTFVPQVLSDLFATPEIEAGLRSAVTSVARISDTVLNEADPWLDTWIDRKVREIADQITQDANRLGTVSAGAGRIGRLELAIERLMENTRQPIGLADAKTMAADLQIHQSDAASKALAHMAEAGLIQVDSVSIDRSAAASGMALALNTIRYERRSIDGSMSRGGGDIHYLGLLPNLDERPFGDKPERGLLEWLARLTHVDLATLPVAAVPSADRKGDRGLLLRYGKDEIVILGRGAPPDGVSDFSAPLSVTVRWRLREPGAGADGIKPSAMPGFAAKQLFGSPAEFDRIRLLHRQWPEMLLVPQPLLRVIVNLDSISSHLAPDELEYARRCLLDVALCDPDDGTVRMVVEVQRGRHHDDPDWVRKDAIKKKVLLLAGIPFREDI